MTARTPQRQRLMELLGPVITSHGYDLEELSVSAAGRRSVIRVIVDGDEGIDLDAVAAIARAISETLDEDDANFAGPFVLEVSSPGVDRPLTEPRHWRRSVGRVVTVDLRENDGASVTGRVMSADGETVVLEVAGAERPYSLRSLGIGRVQVEFSRPGSAESGSAGADEVEEEEEA